MIFEQISVGGDRNFAYLIGDVTSRLAALVDPAYRPELLLERAAALGLSIAYLINTHGHHDHAGGNAAVLAASSARLIAAGAIADGERLSLGRVDLTLILTPGHSSDSLCVLAEEPGAPGKLVTGDTLFVGKVGGTGFGEDARAQYHSLHEKLLVLPEATEVWPGHDVGVAPRSTLGEERRSNPFLLCRDFSEFVELKRNWLEYKRLHGIA